MAGDLGIVAWWWATLFVVGIAGRPWARMIFKNWHDEGYLMAKAVGIAMVTFVIWVGGMAKILPFGQLTAWLVIGVVWWVGRKFGGKRIMWKTIVWEEGFFLAGLIFWAWIKAHEPTINGLEKFMDYGFTRSILQGKYFPPLDMWFAGGTINYYYFGHLMLAVLTRLSGLALGYTFNLMLATIFALCLTQSFSIGRQLLGKLPKIWAVGGAILIAYLVTLSGNLHTIYAFTSGYAGQEDNPPPFWSLKLTKEGGKSYWYPNATRFIPWTIHEFPGYSFVVSDVHGHVLSIPLVLLAIAMLVNMFAGERKETNWKEWGLFGGIAGLMFMTNALDGIIYLGLFATLTTLNNFQSIKPVIIAGIMFVITILPFVLNFEPFVSGVAVNCPPAFLANSRIGPVIFEGVDKCQRSPVWMMLILWGFFIYNAVWLWFKEPKNKFFRIVSLICLGLIIFPEFFYFKDIYPLHFRSNTMFKLGYQVFILMAIVSGYAIVSLRKNKLFWLGLIPLLFLVMIYPKFAVNSYFGELKNYQGIYGLKWLEEKYADDWNAIGWLEENEPPGSQVTIVEASGDSYTDFGRISTFSGLPTVAGWTVHEWLWRGGYDPIAQRIEVVRVIYESEDVEAVKRLMNEYEVKYVIVGEMERQKYKNLSEDKFNEIGGVIFESGSTKIYLIQQA